ncbi:hypothetical protein [Glycomyces sp. MUSA5-2]|uniref:hypothetical protein n=1 Tax=Glycomyces sp. MUSA5-2 TaxID=2053002 RepID=UPI00300AA668
MDEPAVPTNRARPWRPGLGRRLLTSALALVMFAVGMGLATVLSERPWWEPAPTRAERLLGPAAEDPGGLCSATAWEAADSNSPAFTFTGLTTSPEGSFANAGGCRVAFDLVIDGRPAGSAEVAIEMLWAYPRTIPWGPASGCTRTLQTTPDLADALAAAGADLAADADACLVSTDSGADQAVVTIWAHRIYGDYHDYLAVTLTDEDPEPDPDPARTKAFADFVAQELWSVIDRYLPV